MMYSRSFFIRTLISVLLQEQAGELLHRHAVALSKQPHLSCIIQDLRAVHLECGVTRTTFFAHTSLEPKICLTKCQRNRAYSKYPWDVLISEIIVNLALLHHPFYRFFSLNTPNIFNIRIFFKNEQVMSF